MLWRIEGESGFELIGEDEYGASVVLVKTGGSHWSFSFPSFGGSGKVRVGDGCDYNPLQMIEAMFDHVVHGIEVPISIEMDEAATFDFGKEFE